MKTTDFAGAMKESYTKPSRKKRIKASMKFQPKKKGKGPSMTLREAAGK